MTTLTREAYERLIAENLEWLLKQPRTLERDHIEMIVRRSAMHEYSPISKHIPEQNEWVKVTERLPPDNVQVLVHGGIAVHYAGGGWWTRMVTPEREIQWEVTDWMPLPTPPSSLATPSEPLGVTKEKK